MLTTNIKPLKFYQPNKSGEVTSQNCIAPQRWKWCDKNSGVWGGVNSHSMSCDIYGETVTKRRTLKLDKEIFIVQILFPELNRFSF